MTVFRELDTHLEVWTDTQKMEIDNILKAERPNAEHEPRVAMGKDDGFTRYYKATSANGGTYFRIGSGFKKRLLQHIRFDQVEELSPIPFKQNPLDFLRDVLPTLPFVPYKHQLKTFMGLVRERHHLGIVATGGGKSMIAYLSLRYLRGEGKKIILVVPTIGLTTQMFEDFKDYNAPKEFLDEIRLIGGENDVKKLDKPVIISTWQSLRKVMPNIKEYDAIFVDEAHQAKADVLQEILEQDVSQKLGLTGSMPIIKVDAMSLEQSLGKPTRYINARELMKLNLLTHTTVVSLFLNHPRNQTRSGLKYQEEVKFIRESPSRSAFVSKFLTGLKGVTVALYAVTEHGEKTFYDLTGVKLTTKMKSDFEMMKKLGVFFMSGSTKSGVREQIRQYLNDVPNAIVIGQMAVLSTGINIPRLKNLVFLSSTKSYTLVLQSMGRVMRLHKEKGESVYVFDLVDCFTYVKDTYSLTHFWQRKEYYESEGHPVLEREVDLSKY